MIKKKIFLTGDNEKKINDELFYQIKKHPLLFMERKKIYFLNSSRQKNEIEIIVQEMSFEEKNYQEFCKLILPAIETAKKLSKSKIFYNKKTERDISTSIWSSFYKADHKKPISIFYFLAEIFVNLFMGHKLIDGNKRFSLVFLKFLLKSLGFHLKWEGKYHQNAKKYIPKICEFVKFLENGYNCDKIKPVVSWIRGNSIIDFEI